MIANPPITTELRKTGSRSLAFSSLVILSSILTTPFICDSVDFSGIIEDNEVKNTG
jgi:hypothetical protein